MYRFTLSALLLSVVSSHVQADTNDTTWCQPLALDCLPQMTAHLGTREQTLSIGLQQLEDDLAAFDARLEHRAQLIDSNAHFLAEGRRLYQDLEGLPKPGIIRFLGQDYQDRSHIKAQLASLFDEQARLQTVQAQEQAAREQLALQQSQWRTHLQAIQDYQAELPQQQKLLEQLASVRQEADALEQQRLHFETHLVALSSLID